MIELIAHITPPDTPMIWLAAVGGFVTGVAVTYVFVARKWK